MARDIENSTPIESKDDLIHWFEQGCKPASQFRVGTEHEKFGVQNANGLPVPYEGEKGIRKLLEGMQGLLGWQPIMESDYIIGLLDVTGGGAISLEPGGQFELSGAPLKNIHETAHEITLHLEQVKEVAKCLGISFFAQGVCPNWSREQMPQMPKGRYKIMQAYMPKVGTMGLDMMFRTTTVQANLDFSSQADMVKKYRVSLCLQPLTTALFANSSCMDGKATGFKSMRSEIWRHTDPHRTGMIPFVFDENFGFERYMEWVLDVPMYFVKRGAQYIDVSGKSFRAFMDGKLEGFEGQKPTQADWSNHLSTTFAEVRMKRYLEMRGADAGSYEMLLACPAFWVGALYDQTTLDALYDRVMQIPYAQFVQLREDVPRLGLEASFEGKTLKEFGLEVLTLVEQGLKNRNALNAKGQDESHYLAPLWQILTQSQDVALDCSEKTKRAYLA